MILSKPFKILPFAAAFWMAAAFTLTIDAAAHGPGGHGDNVFTALQAVEKGMALYNRLIAEGKLDKSWETGLSSVGVKTRGSDASMEYVIRFNRKEKEPKSVYIFFDMEGKYTGSNFTGE